MSSFYNVVMEFVVLCFVCHVSLSVYPGPYSPPASRLYRTWSEWTSWSSCSRSCGTGVRVRTRTCRLRIAAGSFDSLQTCAGPTTEYDLCGRQKCGDDSDFKLFQCSLHNGKIRGGFLVDEWIPVTNSKRPCELQCISRDRKISYSFGKAIDGTPCKTANVQKGAICVNGRCSNVDCAGQLGNDNRSDMCGVCRGDNSTCVHYRNSYWGRARWRYAKTLEGNTGNIYDYEVIAEIPTGATHIHIRETSPGNFLALMDERGKFILNGNWKITTPGVFLTEHGSEVAYHRSDSGHESISMKGPTDQNLLVLVIGTGSIPTVDYEYWLSNLHQPIRKSYLKEYFKSYYALSPPPVPDKRVQQNLIPNQEINSLESKDPVKIVKGYKSYYQQQKLPNPATDLGSYNSNPSHKNSTKTNSRENASGRIEVRVLHHGDLTTLPPTSGNKGVAQRKNVDRLALRRLDYEDVSTSTQRTSVYVSTDSRFLRNNQTMAFTATFPEKTVDFPFIDADRNDKASFENGHQHKRDSDYRKKLLSAAGKTKSSKKGITLTKKKKRHKVEDITCSKCSKAKQQRKNFCVSDFVLRIEVLSSDTQENELRYEVKVIQSYKNKVPISLMEFIWTPGLCRCPHLRVNQEYIIMGHLDASKRESRLVVDRTSFTRRYTRKRARDILTLVRDQRSKCRKYA